MFRIFFSFEGGLNSQNHSSGFHLSVKKIPPIKIFEINPPPCPLTYLENPVYQPVYLRQLHLAVKFYDYF